MRDRNVLRTLVRLWLVILMVLWLARAEYWGVKTTVIVQAGAAVATVILIFIYATGKRKTSENENKQTPEMSDEAAQLVVRRRKAMSASMKLVAVILLVLGFPLLRPVFELVRYAEALRTEQSWPSVKGRIQTVQVESQTSKSGHANWHPVWSYSYLVDGKPYHSASRDLTGRFALIDYDSVGDANAAAAQRPIGAEVTVYYDPFAPQHSVLDRRAWDFLDWAVTLVILIVLVAVFGGVVVLYRASSKN